MIRNVFKKAHTYFKNKKKPPGSLTQSLANYLHSMEYNGLNKMAPFKDNTDRKYVFIGVGSVGRPSVHFLHEFIDVNYQNVHLVDQLDMRAVPSLQDVFKKGAKFTQKRLEDADWEPFFKEIGLKPYDMVIDLTTDTNGPKIVETLRKMSVMYMNTSVEVNWHYQTQDVYEASLLSRYHTLNKIFLTTSDQNNATQLFNFGMNPGVISHFAFQGLLDVANHVLKVKDDVLLAEFVAKKQYNLIAKHLELNTIHSSELDTQISHNLKNDGTFVNTWSCIGLLEEGCEPAQVGWGTHERIIPEGGIILGREGVGFKDCAYKKLHQSWVPGHEFVGMVIPHDEAFSLNRALTAENYSPTVHYVYRLPLQTKQMMESMTVEELTKVNKWRVLNPYQDELTGEDIVGSLLIFAKNPITGENKPWTYWFGSILGQGSSDFFGPTSMQVCSGILTGLKYTVMNNNLGPIESEKVPTDFVMKHTLPYMGRVVSTEADWKPNSTQFSELSVNKKEVKGDSVPAKEKPIHMTNDWKINGFQYGDASSPKSGIS